MITSFALRLGAGRPGGQRCPLARAGCRYRAGSSRTPNTTLRSWMNTAHLLLVLVGGEGCGQSRRFADPSGVTERIRMRKITRAFTGLAAAALAVGMAGPALAATQARPLERVPAHAAFQPRSRQSVIDWNRELITLPGTPGLQPAAIHPTPTFAIRQAAEY